MSAAPKNPARYLRLLLAKVNGNELVPEAAGYFMLKNLLPQYQVYAPELLNDVYAKMATLLSSVVVVGRISNQELKEGSTDILTLSALQARLERPDSASSVSDSDCNKIKTPLVRVVALSSLGQSRLRQKATADALRLFEQAISEASHIKDDQDRLQAKLMLTQLSLDVNSSVGFERAAGVFKEVNQFPEFNINRSALSALTVKRHFRLRGYWKRKK